MGVSDISIIIAVLSSSVITALINYYFSRKKSDTEVESMAIKNFETIVERLTKEVDRNTHQIALMEAKEKIYIENSNLLMKDKIELSNRVLKLEQGNRELHEENKSLKIQVDKLKKELDNKQQKSQV